MSDNNKEQTQLTLEDQANEDVPPQDESDKPHSRRKRQIFDVPERADVGLDGMEEEEFK